MTAHPPATPVPPSAAQYELRRREQRVVVTEVGAGLRKYLVGDRPVLDGYSAEQTCSGGRGQALIPWPNRSTAAVSRCPAAEQRLSLTELDQDNAIHGLTRWADWTLVDRGDTELRVRSPCTPSRAGRLGWAARWSTSSTKTG